jgi:hypothetical protein
MQLALYNALKTRLEAVTALKYVALWNNQFEREDVNVSFNYPCAFIEFTDISYVDDLQLRQRCSMTVNIHVGFESYKTEDTSILTLKQTINKALHGKSLPNITKMLRRSETQNFDHTNIQEYIIGYEITGLDVESLDLPTTEAQIDTLDLNTDPQIINFNIRTGSIPESIVLSTETNNELLTESGYELIIQK